MISKRIKNLKIATVLPYKENYSFRKASAVSLWVSEFFKDSKFNKDNYIYGSTKSKDFLTRNYINFDLKTLDSRFLSTTNEYIKKLVKEIEQKKFDLIEIHNRPLILFSLINKFPNNYVFYFHNDPLSMKGSKTISERLFILKNVKKIIFISKWVKSRFFFNLDINLATNTEIIYHSVKKTTSNKKK